MKDIIPAKKQSPILGLTGMGGGVGGNLGGSLAEKTYIEDVYSTYLYKGNNTSRTISNGIDLAGKGGMVWLKNRDATFNHTLFDTERGTTKIIRTSTDGSETTGSQTLTAFNSNGFSLGTDSMVNSNNDDTTSWSFRKQKGFFDIVTFQQSGADSQTTPQVVPHNLGAAPGMILLKKLNGDRSWFAYHRDLGKDYWIKFNENGVAVNENNSWGTTTPDANNFGYMSGYIGGGGGSAQFVAYLFGGGESTAATARSVSFDGSNDYLSLGASTDFDMGTGDFTIECWVRRDASTNNNVFTLGSFDKGLEIYIDTDNKIGVYGLNSGGGSAWIIPKNSTYLITPGLWYHIALVRHSGTLRLYVNGIELGSTSHNYQVPATDEVKDFFIGIEIGHNNSIPGANPYFDGEISNVRVVKGTAVYTSSFRPPTEPLTNITNTKLLCCNNSSVTGSTVTPGTITANSSPTASTDSPFDDPDGFKFGEEGDQNIVKCGSYVGNGNNDGPEINLGWEPQFLLFKNSNGNNENWRIYDSMRGWVTGGNDLTLLPNTNDQEVTNQNFASITSTGFKVVSNDAAINTNGNKIIYMAIRRPDGYVGKPVESATDVFNMSRGSGTAYCQTAGFPVDWGTYRAWNGTQTWWNSTRLTQGFESGLDEAQPQNAWAPMMFDSNTKWINTTQAASVQAWAWKRHTGFDVVTYKGTNGNVFRRHNLGRTPEMIIFKNRDATRSWRVYHKGLNGGTNPEDYAVALNSSSAQGSGTTFMNSTAPTSTHFVSGNDGDTNGAGDKYMVLLFASVNGISKVGYYTGNGQTLSNGKYITTGFQPRYVFLKRTDGSGNWYVMDSLRGFGTPGQNTTNLYFNSDNTETGSTLIEVDTTGFRVVDDSAQVNGNGNKYIYYAHA